ncbi:hypothetical protein K440DRAFT_618732 [Wilcoxina mikolae CBS 423.85]|nr:hypothetical protein K440DRAFT_618732 [Wilcoxina mikolae CBS 423.85]
MAHGPTVSMCFSLRLILLPELRQAESARKYPYASSQTARIDLLTPTRLSVEEIYLYLNPLFRPLMNGIHSCVPSISIINCSWVVISRIKISCWGCGTRMSSVTASSGSLDVGIAG